MGTEWLTVEEVAERLRMHPDTIRRLLREGKIEGHIINRRAGWRVRPSAIDDYVTGAPTREGERAPEAGRQERQSPGVRS
jgi:excisionase family DNA binding protein